MKKKIILGIIAAIIIIAALMGVLYFTTDMFKSPQQLFYKHLASDVNFLGKTSYSDAMKEAKKEIEASRENAGEITAKITSDDVEAKQVGTVLEKGKITYNVKSVGKEKKSQGDITLNYDGKDIVTLNYLQNGEQYGIKVADAYDKYISVENNNLKALFQKLGVNANNIPDKIEMVDYYELFNIDEATLKHIEDTYAEVIKQNIPQENYSVEKNVKIEVNGWSTNTNAYKLTLTEEQTKNILIKIFETLKTDETTLNLILDKYNKMIEPYKMMGMSTTTTMTEMTKESLVEAIDETIKELNDTSASSINTMEIIAYGAKDKKARIEMNVLENQTNVFNIKVDMSKDENKGVQIEMTTDEVTMKLTAVDAKEKTSVILNAMSDDTKMEFAVSTEGKNTTAKMDIESEGTKVELNIKDELKATDNVMVENFSTENAVKLNDMSQAEINALVQTIAANVQKVLPQKAQLLGINL